MRAALATGAPADVHFAEQKEQRGTGHALVMARGTLPEDAAEVLLLYADVPLLAAATVQRLLAHHRARRAAATVLTFTPADPTGYGRIVRRGRRGPVVRIVEERDATAAQRRIGECNSGIYCFDPRAVWPALDRLSPDNDQGELYLTDVIAAARPPAAARGVGPRRRPDRGRRRERPEPARPARGRAPGAHAHPADDRGGHRARPGRDLRRARRHGGSGHRPLPGGPASRAGPRSERPASWGPGATSPT